ncbi:MAG TPA: microcin C ABC transporter permease YejB [Stellaceae bacterium]|nr:microcin C ABC transporter permease YejB [Stellaceae bacterium]
MIAYALRRILLIIPTLIAIIAVNFFIVQAAPGGPVEQLIAELKGNSSGGLGRITGSTGELAGNQATSAQAGAEQSRGARGLDPQFIAELNKLYGFDKPLIERFSLMLGHYLRFDFGTSFFTDRPVIRLIADKLPVSISLGLWTTLLTYLVSIPLGIKKAVRDGSRFDLWTSSVVIIAYAVPSFIFAVLLVVLFAGSSYLSWFPLSGLTSDDWSSFDWPHRLLDYLWHIALPVISLVIGSFAGLTLLTKNSFLEEINKLYVATARAKGLSEARVLYGHVFRNAMLLVIAGFPAAFVAILFTGALLVEVIFSLDGLGYLGYKAALGRDYPIMFGTLYIYTLVGLVLKLVSDLTYMLVDPRIDFATRRA